jgi:hypothetical protein
MSVAAIYLMVGILFGLQAGRVVSGDARIAWRWAAWIVSAGAFGWHIVHERIRLGNSSVITAWHASLAAAVAAFGLALAANIHSYLLSAHEHAFTLRLSLAIWPAITGVPAFLVALVGAILLARLR